MMSFKLWLFHHVTRVLKSSVLFLMPLLVFAVSQISVSTVTDQLSKLDVCKATGSDGLSVEAVDVIFPPSMCL